jgi:hypothetical protein
MTAALGSTPPSDQQRCLQWCPKPVVRGGEAPDEARPAKTARVYQTLFWNSGNTPPVRLLLQFAARVNTVRLLKTIKSL